MFALAARYNNFDPSFGGFVFCDVDGDGHPDAVGGGGTSYPRYPEVWRGHGNGTLEQTPVATPGLRFDGATILGDVDGDGRCDLVNILVNTTGQSTGVSVARGQADFTFNASTGTSAALISPARVSYVGDLNRDGRLDFVFVEEISVQPNPQQAPQPSLYYDVLLGQPSSGMQALSFMSAGSLAGFDATPSIAIGYQPIADVDGDGNPDIAVPLQQTGVGGVVAIAYGTGDGQFKMSASPNIVPQANGMMPAGLADFDHDGRADLVAYDGSKQPAFRIIWSEVGGSFTAGPSLEFTYVGDFDGDGLLDIFANYGSGIGPTMGLVYLHDGPRAFRHYPNPVGPAMAVADIDGDGATDLFLEPQSLPWSIYLSTAKHPEPAAPDLQCAPLTADQCAGLSSF